MVVQQLKITKRLDGLPTDGPKTLNGLVLEQLENIPDGNISLIDNYCFETDTIEGAMVKSGGIETNRHY